MKAQIYGGLEVMPMAVCRVEKNKNYTTMANYHLRDPNLSNKARGLLSMFQTWGIPGSYLVFSKESDLAELMENELIAPEDAGYIPVEEACDDECCCDCCGCEGCPYAACEDDEDEADNEADGIDDFAETMAELSAHIHSIFGDSVSVHIIVE